MVRNWKRIASAAYGCALARLALNMYLYLGELPVEYEESGKQKQWEQQYRELLGWYLDGEYVRVLEKIDGFREQVRQEMETLVAYSDAIQIYEYALSRMERRFVEDLPQVEVGEEELTGNLMRYLAADGDVTLQNQRIREILRQLPVRFTRQKYFSMVHDALTTYIGADRLGLEEEMYLLRSSSLIEISRKRKEDYEQLNRCLDQLFALSFRDLTKVSYKDAREQMSQCIHLLTALSEACNNLEEMVNDLYILCLTGNEALRDSSREEAAQAILRGLMEQYRLESREIPEDIAGRLPELEGIQEEYYEKYQALSYRQGEAVEQEDETDRLAARVDMLMSSSSFARLEGKEKQGSVTREELEEVAAAFLGELEPILSSCQKPVMRAIMANTLSDLPIVFGSPDELQDYIQNSLSCCTDPAEKATCMELLLQIMETDGYELV